VLSERAMALDVVYSLRFELTQDSRSLTVCSHPEVREAFRELALGHEAMLAEAAALVRRKGWSREPDANAWVASQLVYHVERSRRPEEFKR